MISVSWKPLARAPRGKILVERDPVQSQRHGLYIPDSYMNHSRTATGTVVDIHPSLIGFVEYEVGDYCALSPTGGRQIVFGFLPSEETELWVFSPKAIKMVFLDSTEYEEEGESHWRNQKRQDARTPTVDKKWTEGDRSGIR